METCLREIWIVHSASGTRPKLPPALEAGAEIYRGAEAYHFALKVACGLKSAILGETEIFGQFKKAWATVSQSHPESREIFGRWIMDLFEDTKTIRTQFLQGQGGSSYGTLLRRLLNLSGQEKLLFLGAGQLCESLLPYFSHHPIRVWNRSPQRLSGLKMLLAQTHFSQIELGGEADANWADQIIFCLPGVPAQFAPLFEAESRAQIAHLGLQRCELSAEAARNPGIRTLTELFSLRDEIQEVRDLNFKRAERTCLERALHRIPKACETLMPRKSRAVGLKN